MGEEWIHRSAPLFHLNNYYLPIIPTNIEGVVYFCVSVWMQL